MSQKSNFKKLQDEWYDKLKNEGFVDIEDGQDRLKFWSSTFHSAHDTSEWQAKFEYYRMASMFLEEYKFANSRTKIIWEYHANGISIRNIVKILKNMNMIANRTDVCYVIQRLKNTMYDMYMAPKEEYHE